MMNENEKIEIIETSDTVIEEKKSNGFKDFFAKFKSKKMKNQALFKKGGFSLAITALVLAGLILFNWIVSSLGNRFDLTYDMTTDKKNSISQENSDYLKTIKDDVNVVICCPESMYIQYMQYMADAYGVIITSVSDLEYFNQTLTLLSRYSATNDKIHVEFMDPQDTAFTDIAAKYSNEGITYGDIIVTSSASEEYKILRFTDIYAASEDSSNSYITLAANRLETSLTSAIAYVTNSDVKKVGIIIGHSNNDCHLAYQQALQLNNYKVTLIEDKVVNANNISNDYDLLVISAPTTDFTKSELDIISDFLDNDGKLEKGLIYFADAAAPALPNLYGFLKQWGIEVSEGKLFETDINRLIMSNNPAFFATLSSITDDSEIITPNHFAVTDYNVPMKTCDASTYERTTKALLQTSESAVIAPKDAATDWAEYTDSDKQQFDCVIQSTESDFDSENREIKSYVMAFSSVEFIHSQWAEDSATFNKDIVLNCTKRAAHVDSNEMVFTAKVIENESFLSMKDAKSDKIVNTIFLFIIPISIIVIGIVIFVRRRNAR